MNFLTEEQRHLRASDKEREEVIDHLKVCAREGRIGVDELGERVQNAMTAKTLGELQDLCIDLPDNPTASLVQIDDGEQTDFSDTQLSDYQLEAWRQDRLTRHRTTRSILVFSLLTSLMLASLDSGSMMIRPGLFVLASVILMIVFLLKKFK